jgi:hypothetical protein
MKKKLPPMLGLYYGACIPAPLLCLHSLMTHHSLLPEGSKLRQCYILGYVIENYFYRHVHCDVSVFYFYEIS